VTLIWRLNECIVDRHINIVRDTLQLSAEGYLTYRNFIYLLKNKLMTNQDFCEIYSSYYGEKITHVDQVAQTVFTGKELKELIEFFIKELKEEDWSNQQY